jgi:CheY-like chemotaxis protein
MNRAAHLRPRVFLAVADPGAFEPALVRMGVDLTCAASDQDLVERVLSEDFDLLLIDPRLLGPEASQAVALLSKAGSLCPAVAVCAQTGHQDRTVFGACLDWPLDPLALKRHVDAAAARRAGRPVFSARALSFEGETGWLQKCFFERLPQTINQLDAAVRAGDIAEIEGITHVLKGCGTTFGLPHATQACREIAQAIERGRYAQVIGAAGALVERLRQDIAQGLGHG